MKKPNGFTLVELLITIAIIAILATVGIVAYSTVLKQGRDAKRQSDLRAIQSALEQYYSDQGFYPAASPNPLTPNSSLTSSTGNPSPPPTSKTYMNTIPNDLDSTKPYIYLPLKDTSTDCNNLSTKQCNKYCLITKLDSLTTPDLKGCSVSGSYSTYNFALTPP